MECVVVNGGTIGERQGINLPGGAMAIPALTAKDKRDLKFGLKHGVDAVALSFVRSADDIREAQESDARIRKIRAHRRQAGKAASY